EISSYVAWGRLRFARRSGETYRGAESLGHLNLVQTGVNLLNQFVRQRSGVEVLRQRLAARRRPAQKLDQRLARARRLLLVEHAVTHAADRVGLGAVAVGQ